MVIYHQDDCWHLLLSLRILKKENSVPFLLPLAGEASNLTRGIAFIEIVKIHLSSGYFDGT